VRTVNTRGRWLLRVGVLVVAGVTPLLIGAIGAAGRAEADCLSYFGSRNDGMCLNVPPGTAQSQGGAFGGGAPPVAVGPGQNGGAGISTGPLLPGQTINKPLTP
jgi:hypothetical protein